MPGEDRINSIIDIPAVKAEYDQLVTMLQQLGIAIKQAGNGDGMKNMYGSMADFRKTSQDAKQATDAMATAVKNLDAQMEKTVSVAKAAVGAQAQISESMEQNIRTLIRYQTSMKSYQADLKEDAELLKKGIINQAEYKKRVDESSAKIAIYKQRISDLNGVIKFQVKETDSATGSLIEMNAKLELMRKSYRGLAADQRAGAIGQAMKKEIKVLDAALKEADGEIGNHQRKVGDYTGGIQKAFSGAWSGIRKLAYLVPGLGIAGAVSLIADSIVDIVKALDLFSKKLDDTKIHTQDVVDVNKEATNQFAKESVELEVLKDRFTRAGASAGQKKEVIKELNSKFSDYGVNIKNVQEAEDFFVNKTPQFIAMMDAKAKATAAFQLATEHYQKALEAQAKADSEFLSTGDEFVAIAKAKFSSLSGIFGTGVDAETLAKTGIEASKISQKNRKRTIDEEMKKYQDLLKIGADFQQKYDEQQKKFGFAKTGTEASKKFFDQELKAQAEAYKKLSEAQSFNETTRIDARKKAFDLELKILEGKRKIEIGNAKGDSVKLMNVQNEYADARKALEIKLAQDVVAIRYNAAGEAMKLEEKAAKETTDALIAQEQARNKAITDLIEKQFGIRKSFLDQAKAFELTNLENDYASGKIQAKRDEDGKLLTAEDVYQQKKADIESHYRIRSLQAEEDKVKQEIDFKKKAGEDTTSLEAKYAELELQIAQETNKKKIEADKKHLEEKKALQQAEYKLAEQAYDFGVSLIEGQYTKRLNAIQDEIDANSKLRDEELKRIEQSTLSEQDKAAKIAQIQAETAAKNEALERRQRDIKVKEAKFERDAAALKILGETLFQAAKAGWITPVAIALEAIGAAQIATLYAKPLPKFATGTDSSPEGPAIVGEKGHEIFITPGGEMGLTPNKATLTWLEKGTKIVPNDELNRMILAGMFRKTAGNISPRDSKVVDEIKGLKQTMVWHAHEMGKAIKKQRQPVVNNIRVSTAWGDYVQKNVFD